MHNTYRGSTQGFEIPHDTDKSGDIEYLIGRISVNLHRRRMK